MLFLAGEKVIYFVQEGVISKQRKCTKEGIRHFAQHLIDLPPIKRSLRIMCRTDAPHEPKRQFEVMCRPHLIVLLGQRNDKGLGHRETKAVG